MQQIYLRRKMIKKFFDKTMIKFLIVGVINTLVGSGAMFLLYNFAGCSYWISSAANYVIGGIVSFFLNKYFTFQNKERSFLQVVKFVICVAVCYFIAYGIAKPAAEFLLSDQSTAIKENVAMFAGMGIYTALNYIGQRFFAFDKKEKQ